MRKQAIPYTIPLAPICSEGLGICGKIADHKDLPGDTLIKEK